MIRIDQRHLPLLLVTHEGTSTDEEFAEHLATLSASLLAPSAALRAVIIDSTAATSAPATQRRQQAKWMAQHAALLEALTITCVFVIPSSVMRGVLTAIFWLQPLPCPYDVCATLHEGITRAEDALRARHIMPPLNARRAWLKPQGSGA